MKRKNKFIVLEGIDGVGKTTIARELIKALQSRGIPAISYEEYELTHPGFNPLKPLVKELPVAGSHLFYLASSIYKSQEIKKLLKKSWVVCDRFFYSTNANHKARGSTLKTGRLSDLLKPDYAFLLTVDEKARQKRVLQKTQITKMDRVRKKTGSLPYRMENSLKKMGLKRIDNSVSIEQTVDRILSLIRYA